MSYELPNLERIMREGYVIAATGDKQGFIVSAMEKMDSLTHSYHADGQTLDTALWRLDEFVGTARYSK